MARMDPYQLVTLVVTIAIVLIIIAMCYFATLGHAPDGLRA